MTTIEVPGEATLFRSYNIPPERVTLPRELRLRIGWLTVLWLACLVFTALLLLLFLVATPFFLPILASNWLLASTRGELLDVLLTTGLVVLMCAFVIPVWGALVTFICDALRRGPALILREDGLIDRRSSEALIPWSDVEHAKFLHTQAGVSGVRLLLRHDLPVRWNPFRTGTLGFRWRRRPRELYVAILFLNERMYIIAHAIVELVKRAGGTVETRPDGAAGIHTPKSKPRSSGAS